MSRTDFVVFGTGRSGSTLLVDILNNNPQFFCEREIFHRTATRKNPLQEMLRRYFPLGLIMLRRHHARQRFQRNSYGFLLHTKYGGEQVRRPDLLLRWLHIRGWRIVWLYRRDIFAQIISTHVADTSRRYHGSKDQKPREESVPFRTAMELNGFERYVRNAVRIHQKHRTLMQQLPHLTVVYEDDLKQADQQVKTLVRLSAELGQPYQTDRLNLRIEPPWKEPYHIIVENYDELRSRYREMMAAYPADQKSDFLIT
jgi:LPS sulfotransferase NodH